MKISRSTVYDIILCSFRHQILYTVAIMISIGIALNGGGEALPPLQAEGRGGTCPWCFPASATYDHVDALWQII